MNQTELYNKYSWILFQVSNKYGNQSNVKDLFQEGYLALVNCVKHFDNHKENFKGFAYICVRNRIFRYLNRDRFVSLVEDVSYTEYKLWEYLPDLPEEENQIIDLLVQGFSHKEISEQTNVSYKETLRNINKIKEKIRDCNEANFIG